MSSPGPLPHPRNLIRYPIRRAAVRSRITRPYWRRRFAEFGARTILHRPGEVLGAHKIAIGANCVVLRGTYLAVETPAWESPGPVLRIGDRVGIRPYCMISAAEEIVIEDDVIIGAFCSVIDSD